MAAPFSTHIGLYFEGQADFMGDPKNRGMQVSLHSSLYLFLFHQLYSFDGGEGEILIVAHSIPLGKV